MLKLNTRLTNKSLFTKAKNYHKRHPWRLNKDGIYVRHVYDESVPQVLSWWDDFGFIYAKRRIMVWWQHPRMKYQDSIEELSYDLLKDEYPLGNTSKTGFLDGSEKLTRKLKYGSRKKTIGYRMAPLREELKDYFKKQNELEKKLSLEDQGWSFKASVETSVQDWCQGISLVYPIEVHSEEDLSKVRDLVSAWLRGDRQAFENAPAYGFKEWKADLILQDKTKV